MERTRREREMETGGKGVKERERKEREGLNRLMESKTEKERGRRVIGDT